MNNAVRDAVGDVGGAAIGGNIVGDGGAAMGGNLVGDSAPGNEQISFRFFKDFR